MTRWHLHYFEHDPPFQSQTEIRDDDGLFVCCVEDCPSPIVAADWQASGLFDHDEPQRWERQRANARLIAAAPDLLATLQRLLAAESRMGGNNPLAGLCDEARELIARTVG